MATFKSSIIELQSVKVFCIVVPSQQLAWDWREWVRPDLCCIAPHYSLPIFLSIHPL